MKELTRKQKIDFLVYCMNEIAKEEEIFADRQVDIFVCLKFLRFMRFSGVGYVGYIIKIFPELLLFSRDKKVIKYYELTSSVKEDNATRAIILSFIYNML